MFKERLSSSYPFRQHFEYSVSAAKNYISLYPQIATPSEEQLSMLAAAHYTLALQQDIPLSHCKMHTNAAITLLQNLSARSQVLNSMMANAYFRRAELFEQENAFKAAGQDYQKTLEVFKHCHDNAALPPEDKLLLAQSAISLADLILNHEPDLEHRHKNHPLFYVNKSLEFLADLPRTQDEIWTTLAYAHQVAGLALSNIDIDDAKEAFRTAIAMSFKTEPKIACRMLGDIYNSLGLLYEQQFRRCPIQKVAPGLSDQAMVYFGIALFFSPGDDSSRREGLLGGDSLLDKDNILDSDSLLDSVFDTIYRSLDPFLAPLSPTVLRDFIDALIFTYYCVSDKILPNQTLCQQLAEPDTFNTFAQHIFWLVADIYRREHQNEGLLESIKPCDYDLSLDLSESLASLLSNDIKKIHYLKNRVCQASP